VADTWRNPGLGGKVGNKTTVRVPAVSKKPRPLRMATMPGGLSRLAAREEVHSAYPAAAPISAKKLMTMTKRKK
jgi:hypothetical protein